MGEDKGRSKDYFYATLEGTELILEPYCACGNPLEEEYFCEKCQKQCLCAEIRCENKATLDYVNQFVQSNKHFRNFNAVLNANKK